MENTSNNINIKVTCYTKLIIKSDEIDLKNCYSKLGEKSGKLLGCFPNDLFWLITIIQDFRSSLNFHIKQYNLEKIKPHWQKKGSIFFEYKFVQVLLLLIKDNYSILYYHHFIYQHYCIVKQC